MQNYNTATAECQEFFRDICIAYAKQAHKYQIVKRYGNNVKITGMCSPPRGRVGLLYEPAPRGEFYVDKLYENVLRTRRTVYELALCNEWEYYFTGTINPERFDRSDLKGYFKKFSQWLRDYRKKYPDEKIAYLLIPERHKSGDWHLHGFINGVPDFRLTPFEKGKHPLKLIKAGYLNWQDYADKFGFCSIDRVRSQKAAAAYITKYITKALVQNTEMNAKTYYCSQNLSRAVELCRGYGVFKDFVPTFANEYVSTMWLHD